MKLFYNQTSSPYMEFFNSVSIARSIVVILITIFFHAVSYAYTRQIYLDQELKRGKTIKEIIIRGYTSRMDTFTQQSPITIEKVIDKMMYSLVSNPSSTLIYKTPNTPWINAAAYYDVLKRPDTIKRKVNEGYWPAIGDTVLVVIDSTNRISIFAEITKQKEYKFWSPYHTTSWNTIFLSHAPFKPVPSASHSKENYDRLQESAKELWRVEFASSFYCLIDKIEFWTYLQKLKGS
ncbi:MAG: hypothetical protein ACOVSR_12800 [Bacteroidia bacterium]